LELRMTVVNEVVISSRVYKFAFGLCAARDEATTRATNASKLLRSAVSFTD
jgi:hypothetical protein